MNRWRGIVALACTLFWGSAVWSQPTGVRLPHACDVLTEGDAEYVFGKGARLFRSGSNCTIQPEDNRFLTLGVIEARIGFLSDRSWAATKRGFMMMNPTRSAKQVNDLGDDALVIFFKKRVVSLNLYIKKGATIVQISGLYTDFGTREDLVRYIGERLIAGM
jgi:hypothetical protein